VGIEDFQAVSPSELPLNGVNGFPCLIVNIVAVKP